MVGMANELLAALLLRRCERAKHGEESDARGRKVKKCDRLCTENKYWGVRV